MKISIITVCYNSETTIEDTLQSVLSQTYKDYEYIIVDGKSSDHTLDIVQQFEKEFEGRMKIISEKDNGLYDAMNKGIHMATGEIIGTLNADDKLANEHIFETIVKNFDENTDIIYADIQYCSNDFSRVERDFISGEKHSDTFCPAHPSMYVRKDIFDRLGNYNLKYKIAADYDFMVRCNIHNIRYKYIHEYFVLMRIGGRSNGLKGYLNNFRECYEVLKNNRISFPFIHTCLRSLHTILQIIRK